MQCDREAAAPGDERFAINGAFTVADA